MFNKGFGSLDGRSNALIQNGAATRGKFEGRTLEEIMKHRPDYLVWLSENTDNHGLTPQQIKDARLADDDRQQEDDAKHFEQGVDYDAFWGDK